MFRRLVACLVLFAFPLVTPSARGAEIHVDPLGPLRTVTAAIDSAAFGDTLVLAHGTYFENPRIAHKDLWIRSAPGGRAILDGAPNGGGGNAGSVLRTVNAFVHLEDLVIRNGVPRNVGAGVMLFGGHVTMRNVRLEGNVIGALSVQSGLVPGTLDLEDCEVIGNDFGIDALVSTRVVRTRIEGNGFGMRAVGAIEMEDVQIINNGGSPINATGGCVLPAAFGRLERVVVRNNRSAGQIGGLWLNRGPLKLIDCEISDNSAQAGPGGLACVGVDAELVNVTVKNNISRGVAQAVGGILVDNRADVTALDCTIENNESQERGGGVSVQRESNASFEGCTFRGNVSLHRGGGAYVQRSVATFRNTVFLDNRAPTGAGVLVESGGANLLSCTVVGNQAEGTGGVLFITSSGQIQHSIVAFNTGSVGMVCVGGDVSTACSNVFGNGSDALCGTDLGGNLFVDPGFCDFDLERGEFDLRLQKGSPLQEAAGCGLIGAVGTECEPTTAHSISWGDFKRLYGGR